MAGDSPEFLLRLAREHGPVVAFSIFGPDVLLISRPDMIHEILISQVDRFPKADRDVEILEKVLGTGLLTNNGESHRQRRRLVQPAFHSKRIQAYADTMLGYTQERLETWRDGQTLDMSEEMMRLWPTASTSRCRRATRWRNWPRSRSPHAAACLSRSTRADSTRAGLAPHNPPRPAPPRDCAPTLGAVGRGQRYF